ncbi:ROK family transcriptional regulator [Streptomyces roseus]|uniref:ROK family transcriptional regulator n=1 Tax=Streptomyces roseus TaxID=66430 RepID=A0A0J6XMD4_9ACTN|nr:ROK family transcriptional regulator [Streptomyces roseus]KMO96369.1 ROK family transcriptional regulator [Streptomyces roseus]
MAGRSSDGRPGVRVTNRAPGVPRVLRTLNDRTALELLLEQGPLSRAQIARLTGLSKPTASQMLARLEESGLVVAGGTSAGHPGPGALLYTLNPAAAYVAGLDVTPGLIRTAVADLTGRTIGTYELTAPERCGDEVDQVSAAVEGAARAAGLTSGAIHRVVIGAPRSFDHREGRLRYPSHLPGWRSSTLLEELAARLPMPVDCENDVNLVAIAEGRTGAARGYEDFFLLWNEEGIGAAMMFGGRLHRGRTGGAGEVGFMPVPGTPLVRNPEVAETGGYQDLAGCHAVPAMARRLGIGPVADGAEPHPGTGGRGAADPALDEAMAILRRAATEAEGPYRRLLEEFATGVATGLSAIAGVLDPELVVLSGGVFLAGGEPLRALVEAELAELSASQPPLVLGDIREHPVLRGALECALATTRDEVFDTSR